MAAKIVTAKTIGTPDDPAMFDFRIEKTSLEKIRGIDWFRSDLFVYLVQCSGAVCFGLFSKQTQLNLNKYLYCRDCLTW